MNSEERYCQAERDYDAMREELLMPTPDDHRDESEWRDFLETKVRYYSNVMLSKATTDLLRNGLIDCQAINRNRFWIRLVRLVVSYRIFTMSLLKERSNGYESIRRCRKQVFEG